MQSKSLPLEIFFRHFVDVMPIELDDAHGVELEVLPVILYKHTHENKHHKIIKMQ